MLVWRVAFVPNGKVFRLPQDFVKEMIDRRSCRGRWMAAANGAKV